MTEENSKALFKSWDLDNDNEITPEDLAKALEKAGLPHSEEDVAAMIKGLDPRSTGAVTLQQFVDACSRKTSRHHLERPQNEVADMVSSLARKRYSFEHDSSAVTAAALQPQEAADEDSPARVEA